MLGGVLGLLLGAGISALAYGGLAVIPSRHLFKVTSVLIAFMAAGMAAQSVAFLEQADIATALGSVVWKHVLLAGGIPGRVLHTLLGYTGKPTQLQLLVYLATLGTIFGLMKLAAPQRKKFVSYSGARRGNSAHRRGFGCKIECQAYKFIALR